MRTKVLIVAKTRQGKRACIGGITFEGQSVRLVAADAETNESAGMGYAVGEVWEVDGSPPPALIPPHVENLIVERKRKLGPMTDPVPFIERHMPPKVGGIDVLFEGLAQAADTGVLYISERSGIPPYSTMFWRPDQPLLRDEEGKRIRYRYETPGGKRSLTFVGFQEPVEVIPAGTLVRVSLAHWWRPSEDEHGELRCYVQLSGWFGKLPAGKPPAPAAQPVAEPPDPLPAANSEPDPAEARRLLKSVFGYDTFRPLQAEIIGNVLQRRDTLAVMPTGSGKSLCYQLPALLLPGLTVVVSPLISLMQDQVDQLRMLGIPAAFLNSTLSYLQYRDIMDSIRRGEVKLLYTSPETLLRPEILVMLDRCRVACLAIDEAHCISAWGHDFREDYRKLLPVRQRYPQATCVAFTATATRRVQDDIKQSLGFRDEDEFVAGFDRPNLFLAATLRTNGPGQALAFLQDHRGEPGIVYCSTRKGVDDLSASLQARGWRALPYHAGLDDETRIRNQALFSRDQVPIIVATIAFGMGINKPDVRFVLHYNMPASLENYYQEIGRAGRDGLRADCLLLYSHADLRTTRRFIEEGAAAERPGRLARLQAMLRYAEAHDCRRRLLLEYFDDTPSSPVCSFCDKCLEPAEGEQVDVTAVARRFLSCVAATGQIFGLTYVVDVLRGSKSQKVLRNRHDRLDIYGTGRDLSAGQWRSLADRLIQKGFLAQDMQHGGLRLTAEGRGVLAGSKVFLLAEQPQQTTPSGDMPFDEGLLDRLRTLRRQLAEQYAVPAYVVFADRTLREMAAYFPQSPQSLLAIYGVGERKLEQYGEAFLQVIRDYAAENQLAERSRPVPPPGVPPALRSEGSRSAQVAEFYAAGRSVPELMALYEVKQDTIINHLYRCALAGQVFAAEPIRALSRLSGDDRARVLQAISALGSERLRPIYDALDGAIPYEELHILRLYHVLFPGGSHDAGS